MKSRDAISREEFAQEVRESQNRSVVSGGHHPGSEYTPSAFRHYIRERALLSVLGRLEFGSLLDVGCSEGFFMDAVRRCFGAEVWGIDISDAAVAKARERFGFEVAAADAARLPLPDDSFDVVMSTETIEHVLDPELMVSEMRRVARRHVIVTTPVSRSDHEHEPDYELRDEGHVNDFDRGAVERLFGANTEFGSFRCNATVALVKAVGRYAPAGVRDRFYALDHWTATHLGSPQRAFVPLRNRDWLIVAASSAAEAAAPGWRCPDCAAAVAESSGDFRCDGGHAFGRVAPAIPDFGLRVPAPAPAVAGD